MKYLLESILFAASVITASAAMAVEQETAEDGLAHCERQAELGNAPGR